MDNTPIGTVLLVPMVPMWLLFRDLTCFSFDANHFGEPDRELFTPRFTLTSLRLPLDELDAASAADLERAYRDPRMIELLLRITAAGYLVAAAAMVAATLDKNEIPANRVGGWMCSWFRPVWRRRHSARAGSAAS
jgi:hypothetical protein